MLIKFQDVNSTFSLLELIYDLALAFNSFLVCGFPILRLSTVQLHVYVKYVEHERLCLATFPDTDEMLTRCLEMWSNTLLSFLYIFSINVVNTKDEIKIKIKS